MKAAGQRTMLWAFPLEVSPVELPCGLSESLERRLTSAIGVPRKVWERMPLGAIQQKLEECGVVGSGLLLDELKRVVAHMPVDGFDDDKITKRGLDFLKRELMRPIQAVLTKDVAKEGLRWRQGRKLLAIPEYLDVGPLEPPVRKTVGDGSETVGVYALVAPTGSRLAAMTDVSASHVRNLNGCDSCGDGDGMGQLCPPCRHFLGVERLPWRTCQECGLTLTWACWQGQPISQPIRGPRKPEIREGTQVADCDCQGRRQPAHVYTGQATGRW